MTTPISSLQNILSVQALEKVGVDYGFGQVLDPYARKLLYKPNFIVDGRLNSRVLPGYFTLLGVDHIGVEGYSYVDKTIQIFFLCSQMMPTKFVW